MKATDRQIINAYRKAGSVWKAAKALGMCGQSVHERIKKLKIKTSRNFWRKDEINEIESHYNLHADTGTISVLAKRLGRTARSIHIKANRLGITSGRGVRPKLYLRVWKGMDEPTARKIFEKFKRSRMGVGVFCRTNKLDDLGFSRTMQEFFPDEWDHVVESKIPRTTMYRLGRAVEYAVRNDLRKRGYFVLRSPRSLGIVDLVAIKTGTVLFVQCKRSLELGIREWNGLIDLSESVGATPILAGRPAHRGYVYRRLISRKDGSKRKQPMDEFTP